jgi:hypothetical protein
MSVVFKKNEKDPDRFNIVITIDHPTTSPAEDLKVIINDMLTCLRNVNVDNNNETYYQMIDFMQEMIPDKETYKYFLPGYKAFNPEPLRRLLEEAGPGGVVEYLQIAIKHLGNIVDQGPRKLDVIDSINHIKGIIEAIEGGMNN